jgi:putative ABC transport system permease protein
VLKLAWAGVRRNPGRYIATLVAIMTGVAFFAATGFLADRVIASLEGNVDKTYGAVDAAVTPNDTGRAGTFADDLRLPAKSADAIAAVPGVDAVAGVLTGKVAFRAANGSTFANDATGRLWVEDDELNPIDVVDGRAPAAEGEIAVDKGTADKHGLAVGDQVTILTLAGPFPAEVVGITRFGDTDALDSGGTVSIPKSAAFDWLSSGQAEYQELYLRGSAPQPTLVKGVEPLTPPGYQIQSGDEFRSDQRAQVGAPGHYLKYALQGFAILALLVGGFVIYNTFSVIVSQRLRELAVLAAIGATPKQIKRALRYEGLVIGLIGSTLGLIAGFALVFLLVLILEAIGVSLPGSGLKITPTAVVPAILAGTLITVISVMIPARRAARTDPIEALRISAAETASISRRRTIFAIVLIAGGAYGLLFGSKVAIGFGALVLFVGVIVAGPIFAVFGASIARPVMSRFGLEGRLAADNTARSPKRTAITANALLIGVFLVTFVSVAGTSLKDFVVAKIKELETADYVIASTGGTIGPDLVAKLERIDNVTKVVPFRRESVTLDGEASQIFTGDIDALQKIAGVKTKEGSFTDVVPGTIAVTEGSGTTPPVGSTVTVANREGASEKLKVAAIVKFSLDTAVTGNYVATKSFDRLVGDTAPTVGFLDVASGTETDTKDAIEAVTSQRPDISVTEGNEIGRLIGSVFDFLINAVNGLLLMSIVIALIGIINTLSLSILERRRELGLLRSVGMTDRRVRRMVRLESVIISALGTVLGVALGLFTGWALIRSINRLSDAGVAFSLPVGRLALVLALGVVLGVVASLIPSRRSTRLDVLDAIQST